MAVNIGRHGIVQETIVVITLSIPKGENEHSDPLVMKHGHIITRILSKI
jgi:hypothetical protein